MEICRTAAKIEIFSVNFDDVSFDDINFDDDNFDAVSEVGSEHINILEFIDDVEDFLESGGTPSF